MRTRRVARSGWYAVTRVELTCPQEGQRGITGDHPARFSSRNVGVTTRIISACFSRMSLSALSKRPRSSPSCADVARGEVAASSTLSLLRASGALDPWVGVRPERATVEFMQQMHVGRARRARRQAKARWKVDWRCQMVRAEVDYELYGKNLIDSARLLSQVSVCWRTPAARVSVRRQGLEVDRPRSRRRVAALCADGAVRVFPDSESAAGAQVVPGINTPDLSNTFCARGRSEQERAAQLAAVGACKAKAPRFQFDPQLRPDDESECRRAGFAGPGWYLNWKCIINQKSPMIRRPKGVRRARLSMRAQLLHNFIERGKSVCVGPDPSPHRLQNSTTGSSPIAEGPRRRD